MKLEKKKLSILKNVKKNGQEDYLLTKVVPQLRLVSHVWP